MLYPCGHCQKPVSRSPSHVERLVQKKVFCNRRCCADYMSMGNHHRYSRVEVVCRNCGKRLMVRKGRADALYCSHACRGQATRGVNSPLWVEKREVPCGHCGKVMLLSKGKRRRYCNRDCANRQHSRNMTGEGNSNYLHGEGYYPYSTEFIQLRKDVRRRDKYRCFLCDKTRAENGKHMDVHHIDWDKSNNVIENLVCLCMACHHGLVKNKFGRLRQALFLSSQLRLRYGYPKRSITLKLKEPTTTSPAES